MSVSSIPAKVKASAARNQNESESCLMNFVSRNVDDIKSFEMWRGCVGECVGMTILAFFTISFGVHRDGEMPPSILQIGLSVGFTLAIIITVLSTVSGGHVNPAITVGFVVTNQITLVRGVLYVIFQTLGGIAGAAALQAVLPSEYEGSLGLFQPGFGVKDHQALAMEIVISGFLLFGTMACIDKYREDMQGSIPFIIGLIVGVNVIAGARISGGSMNPARAFASAAVLGKMEKQWIYWLGPFIGSVVGSLLYDWFFSTRPLRFISNLLDKTAPSKQYRQSNGNDNDAELSEISEQTKLQFRQ